MREVGFLIIWRLFIVNKMQENVWLLIRRPVDVRFENHVKMEITKQVQVDLFES